MLNSTSRTTRGYVVEGWYCPGLLVYSLVFCLSIFCFQDIQKLWGTTILAKFNVWYHTIFCLYSCHRSHFRNNFEFFIQDALLKVGLCLFILFDVFDDGTTFKELFVTMCDTLHLRYDVVTKCNHRVAYVEWFRCFLNKR